ncbi:hypothetical protein D3C85_1436510 [compost metagenome]
MRLAGLKARKRFSFNGQFTAVGRFHPGDNFHQRRFSRAVTPHQGVDLTGQQREINAFQHRHAGELLVDITRFDQDRHHRSVLNK